jgi:hypothetical protein
VDTYGPDEEREVPLDDERVLPEQTRDDTDQGWGERSTGNDDRLLAERPPHW